MTQRFVTGMIVLAGLLGVGPIGCQPGATPTPDGTTIAPAANAAATQIASDFFEALFLKDRARLEELALPSPGVSSLIAGPEPSAQEIARTLRELRVMPVRHATVGETLEMPGLGRVQLTADDLGPGRCVVVLEPHGGVPVPIIVVRDDGAWRVDARPFIRARHGAAP